MCDYLLMIKQVHHSCYCQEEYKFSLHYWNLSYMEMLFWSVQIFPEFLYSVSYGELLESRHRSVAERCSVSSVFSSWCLLCLCIPIMPPWFSLSILILSHGCIGVSGLIIGFYHCGCVCVGDRMKKRWSVCVDVWVCEHHAFGLLKG